MPAQSLPGFRDFFPEDAALRRQIFDAWHEVAARYGFEEYDGPPLEPRELYEEKSGSEIVEQLYWFVDKGDRKVALRPEMTPTLARMVAARAPALKKPIRWYSLPQLFRYERQQRGRLREHFQLNMDIIGDASALADAEVIAAAIDILRVLGLGASDFVVRLSDRRVVGALLEHHGVAPEQLETAFAAIDKAERVGRDETVRQLTEAWALKGGSDLPDRVLSVGSIRGLDAAIEALDAIDTETPSGDGLRECVEALDAMGLGAFVSVDLSIVRGLAYYTGIVFELFDRRQSLRAICGGGRYDSLLAALGGVDLPAVGFGMGDVVLGELLRDRSRAPLGSNAVDVFVVAVTSADVSHVLALAHTLRDARCRVEYALKPQSLAKQLKLAAARGARHAVVVGPDERAAGVVALRDLAQGTEQRLPIPEIVERLQHSSGKP